MDNQFGLDDQYFRKWMERLLPTIVDMAPQSLARELARMSRAAEPNVLHEDEFLVPGMLSRSASAMAVHEAKARLSVALQFAETWKGREYYDHLGNATDVGAALIDLIGKELAISEGQADPATQGTINQFRAQVRQLQFDAKYSPEKPKALSVDLISAERLLEAAERAQFEYPAPSATVPRPTGLSRGWNLVRQKDGFVMGHSSQQPTKKHKDQAIHDGYVYVPFLVTETVEPKYCYWREEENGHRYEVQCSGSRIHFEDSRDRPSEFCQHCGEEIKVLSPFRDNGQWQPAPPFPTDE
jgi:hypothetical protein